MIKEKVTKRLRRIDLIDPESSKRKYSFSLVYGFRNIQNLIRRIKLKRTKMDYCEVMACPSGCLSGGG